MPCRRPGTRHQTWSQHQHSNTGRRACLYLDVLRVHVNGMEWKISRYARVLPVHKTPHLAQQLSRSSLILIDSFFLSPCFKYFLEKRAGRISRSGENGDQGEAGCGGRSGCTRGGGFCRGGRVRAVSGGASRYGGTGNPHHWDRCGCFHKWTGVLPQHVDVDVDGHTAKPYGIQRQWMGWDGARLIRWLGRRIDENDPHLFSPRRVCALLTSACGQP